MNLFSSSVLWRNEYCLLRPEEFGIRVKSNETPVYWRRYKCIESALSSSLLRNSYISYIAVKCRLKLVSTGEIIVLKGYFYNS